MNNCFFMTSIIKYIYISLHFLKIFTHRSFKNSILTLSREKKVTTQFLQGKTQNIDNNYVRRSFECKY